MTTVKLGLTLPQFTSDGEAFLRAARRAEALDFDSLWLFDHIWPLSGGRQRAVLECWTALAYLAAATERIGVGTLVTRSTLRHPAVLAKMAATVAAIAPGRLTIGVGSGDRASRAENEAIGVPYYAGAERVEQLESTVAVLRAFLSETTVSRRDDYVSIDELPASPSPTSRPTIWVAGRADDALEVAGRYGDGWNGWGGTPERFAQDAAGVAEYAQAAGGRAVELTWGGLVVLGVDDDQAKEKLGDRRSDEYLVGGPQTVARRLSEFVAAGARHLVCTLTDSGNADTVELFGGEVRDELAKLI